ncbi:HNH endonuclease signature motif containing protein [Demequina activiva]|uniref:HNH nuclease domain-containing protein n=1 Tax=Demequina activiva TaxID=1582364 RepID=A0A919Q4P9_9MICO|nr:DUF222 domain-containing protein [Demequina activiva]GIG53795.1 hypothetical protein Dac01nite_05470 [Demequina activiva]
MSSPTLVERPAESGSLELRDALEHVCALLERLREPVAKGTLQGLGDGALMEVQRSLTRSQTALNLVRAAASGEIGRRSRPQDGVGGLSRQNGFRDPAAMIAQETGGSRREARTLIEAGRAMAEANEQARREREAAAQGRPAPQAPDPVYPAVAAALARGSIGVDAASTITRMLDSVSALYARDRLAEVERLLVSKAPGLSAERFQDVVRRHLSWLRAEAAQARQQRMAQERYVTVTEDAQGMVEIRAKLDPRSAAPLRTVLDALVKEGFRQQRDGNALAVDTRTAGQMRADALATMARHFLGCDAAPIAHATTTVVVRMGLEDLRRGAGAAEIDGAGGVLSAGELRQLAVDAQYLPVVLGGASESLDVGRAKRQFTPAQRVALVERDGGCAMCGAPPSHCEAHHIRWWNRDAGRSDLSNGVMLCVACHHTVHGAAWEIRASATEVWFVPPASVDPQRQPRQGGRARFGLTANEREMLARPGPAPGERPDVGAERMSAAAASIT